MEKYVQTVRQISVGLFAAVVTACLAAASPAIIAQRAIDIPPAHPQSDTDSILSVMTYNINGMPFPASYDRAPSLREIGLRLAQLRIQGRQPHIVLLQEAFTPDAKAIGSIAGYRYVTVGASPSRQGKVSSQSPGERFLAAPDWLRIVRDGKLLDGGLMILSDYPIVRQAGMTFTDDACAGYDCLAAKGVLIAWISIPGRSEPIAVANTHLNSRRASGVPIPRANAAFARQVVEAQQFVDRQVSDATGVIFGGDFNIGHDRSRIAAMISAKGIFAEAQEATLAAALQSEVLRRNSDFQAIWKRAKDKQYFRPGKSDRLQFEALRVPFGITQGGFRLSDHLGYVADYSIG
ncbi:MAG: endonuclease/exonuclease/phosphatase family protein [Sphingobium sp.]